MTTTTYIVKSGDWLAKIAEEHGTTVSAIWNHPENADHRRKRGSPDVLYPGDVLRIDVAAPPPQVEPPAPVAPVGPAPVEPPAPPDLPWPYPPFEGPWSAQPTWECPGGTCACHPVPEDEPKDEHVIVFYDPQGIRMPGARCRVYEAGRLLTPEPTTTDGAGEVRVELRESTSTLRVEWAPAHLPPSEFLPYRKIYNVKMGDDRDVGVDKRLANLGFARGKRREDNVRDYQRAYSREPTGNVEEIRLEVLDRHDNGSVTVFHPHEPEGMPPEPNPQTKSLFASPPSGFASNRVGDGSGTSRRSFAREGDNGGGGGAGPKTSTGQNIQGAAVPDAANLIVMVGIETDLPALDPANIKFELRPVKVPGMPPEKMGKPVTPTVAGERWGDFQGGVVYGFKDLPTGTYDALAYVEKVKRANKFDPRTTWAMGHTRVEVRMGLLNNAYVGCQRQRPVHTVEDPLLDFEVEPMRRRRKVLAVIFRRLPMSHRPPEELHEIAGKFPPYEQGNFKPMACGHGDRDTCTAVNGSLMTQAAGVGYGGNVVNHPGFQKYADGTAPSVGDSVYYTKKGMFAHVGIIIESSPLDQTNWLAADGGQQGRTTEFKKLKSGYWGRA